MGNCSTENILPNCEFQPYHIKPAEVECLRLINPFNFTWDTLNPSSANFLIEQNRVTFNCTNQKYYQIVSKEWFPFIGCHSIKIKMLRYTGIFNSCIAIGIMGEEWKRQNEKLSKKGLKTFAYLSGMYQGIGQGSIYEHGEVIASHEHLFVKPGDILELIMDMDDFTIEWRTSDATRAICQIQNKHFKSKKIYFFVAMGWNGDSLEIC